MRYALHITGKFGKYLTILCRGDNKGGDYSAMVIFEVMSKGPIQIFNNFSI